MTGGARAAVLARLWQALVREPIPGIAGRRLSAAPGVIELDGQRFDDPGSQSAKASAVAERLLSEVSPHDA